MNHKQEPLNDSWEYGKQFEITKPQPINNTIWVFRFLASWNTVPFLVGIGELPKRFTKGWRNIVQLDITHCDKHTPERLSKVPTIFAVCNPSDEFSFRTGCLVAFNKAVEKYGFPYILKDVRRELDRILPEPIAARFDWQTFNWKPGVRVPIDTETWKVTPYGVDYYFPAPQIVSNPSSRISDGLFGSATTATSITGRLSCSKPNLQDIPSTAPKSIGPITAKVMQKVVDHALQHVANIELESAALRLNLESIASALKP